MGICPSTNLIDFVAHQHLHNIFSRIELQFPQPALQVQKSLSPGDVVNCSGNLKHTRYFLHQRCCDWCLRIFQSWEEKFTDARRLEIQLGNALSRVKHWNTFAEVIDVSCCTCLHCFQTSRWRLLTSLHSQRLHWHVLLCGFPICPLMLRWEPNLSFHPSLTWFGIFSNLLKHQDYKLFLRHKNSSQFLRIIMQSSCSQSVHHTLR